MLVVDKERVVIRSKISKNCLKKLSIFDYAA